MPLTTVRTMDRSGVHPRTRTYSLDASDAVVVAYATDKCGGVRTGMPDFEAALNEGRSLVGVGSKQGTKHIVLPDARAWFGFPEESCA